ncbi:type II toxin-antitoxin system mRNA interferase toxin, RelE/StbE family [Patescibacteria group bacterium]|nr:type II toxin-antitoxin system mRNA interferase toxin, RelE/StbE family [Patescibacteria group bacterium]
MLSIEYAPEFIRTWKKLPRDLQDEVIDRIELFQHQRNHSSLKVHKLKGDLRSKWSFSVNFRYRIIFQYAGKSKDVAQLLDIGDHTVYDP